MIRPGRMLDAHTRGRNHTRSIPVIADPRVVTALARAVDERAAKAAAAAVPESSVSHIECTVRLEGTVKRGAATMASPTCSLLSKTVVAELLRRLGVTRGAAIKHLREIALEHVQDGRLALAQTLTDANPQLLVAVKQLEEELVSELPKRPRAGAIRIALGVEFERALVN